MSNLHTVQHNSVYIPVFVYFCCKQFMLQSTHYTHTAIMCTFLSENHAFSPFSACFLLLFIYIFPYLTLSIQIYTPQHHPLIQSKPHAIFTKQTCVTNPISYAVQPLTDHPLDSIHASIIYMQLLCMPVYYNSCPCGHQITHHGSMQFIFFDWLFQLLSLAGS